MRVPDVDLSAARRMFAGLPTVAVATLERRRRRRTSCRCGSSGRRTRSTSRRRRDSRTWRNASADPRVSLSVDLGRAWVEIAGIEVRGRAELLPAEHAEMRGPISTWHEKYRPLLAGDGFARFAEAIRELAFLRIVPERVSGWDHARP